MGHREKERWNNSFDGGSKVKSRICFIFLRWMHGYKSDGKNPMKREKLMMQEKEVRIAKVMPFS